MVYQSAQIRGNDSLSNKYHSVVCPGGVRSVGRSLMRVLVPTSVSYTLRIMVAQCWSGFTEYTCDSGSRQ